jgi:ribosomal protein L24
MKGIDKCKYIRLNDIVKIIRGDHVGKLGEVTKVHNVLVKLPDGTQKHYARAVCLRVENINYPNEFSKKLYKAENIELYMTREERVKSRFYLTYRKNEHLRKHKDV